MPPKKFTPILVPRPQIYINSPLYNFFLTDLPQHLTNIFRATNSQQHKAAIQRLRLVIVQLIRINSFACTQLHNNRRNLTKICKTNPPGAVHCPFVCPPQFGQPPHSQQLHDIEAALNQLYGETNILQSFLSAAVFTGTYQEDRGPECCGVGSAAEEEYGRTPIPSPLSPLASPSPPTDSHSPARGEPTLVLVHARNVRDEVCNVKE